MLGFDSVLPGVHDWRSVGGKIASWLGSFLLAFSVPGQASAAGVSCDLFTAEELRDLHVPDAHVVRQLTSVPGAAYAAADEMPLTACTYIGSPSDSGRSAETNVFTVRVSVTELTPAARLWLADEFKRLSSANPEIPPGTIYDVDDEAECAVLIAFQIAMCAGPAETLRVTLQTENYTTELADTSKVRKFFRILVSKLVRR